MIHPAEISREMERHPGIHELAARRRIADRAVIRERMAERFDPEVYEIGEYRAVISFSRSYRDALHWDVRHWGLADGHDANGMRWSYASLEAARAFARGWVARGVAA